MKNEAQRSSVQSEGIRLNQLSSDVKCFPCLGMGHLQIDCNKELVCYKCKLKGHMATDCKSSKKLKMFRFGILGQGFYSIEVPEDKMKTAQNTGLLTII